MQKRIIRFITDHSSVAPEKIRELMMRPDEMATDVGSIVDGNEAVELGIIDKVGGLSDALEELRNLIKNNS
jgi:ATP-dependent protease ClpP protease subunit